MLKVSNETKVGVLAAVAITAMVLGFSYLKGDNLFNPGRHFYVEYTKVPGLNVSDPVELNGFQVGKVKKVYLKEDHSGKVIVKIVITDNMPIPADSEAQLASSSLLGDKAIRFVPGISQIQASTGDTLRGGIEKDVTETIQDQFKPVIAKVNSLVAQLDTAIRIVQGIFLEGDLEDNINKSLVTVQDALETFKNAGDKVNDILDTEAFSRMVDDLEAITNSFKDQTDNIENITGNLSSITDSIASANIGASLRSAQTAIDTLGAILAGLSSGTGTAGKILTDDALYNELTSAISHLDTVLMELQEMPRKYIPPVLHIGRIKYGDDDKKKKKQGD